MRKHLVLLLIFTLGLRLFSLGYSVQICVQFIGPPPSTPINVVNTYTHGGQTHADTVHFLPSSFPSVFCFPAFTALPDSGNIANISGAIYSPNCSVVSYAISTANDTIIFVNYQPCPNSCVTSISLTGASFNELTASSTGLAPFQYLWSPGGQTSSSIMVSSPGNYCVTITDTTGCVSVNCIDWYAPPVNDECADAILLVPDAFCNTVSATTYGATPSQIIPATSCVGNPDDDVWFSFVATSVNEWINVIPTTNMDAVVELRSGSCSSSLIIRCEDTGFSGGQENLLADSLVVGQTYYVRVYGFFSGSNNPSNVGNFDICVTDAPACSASVQVSGQQSNLLVAYSTGLPPFTYLWDDGSVNSSLLVNVQGYYCVSITDANGCVDTACIFVNPLLCQTSIVQSTDSLGTIILMAESDSLSGFISSFNWSDGSNTQVIYPNIPGNYCVTVTYASGCYASTCYYFDPSPTGSCSVFASAVQDSINPSLFSFFAYPLGTPPFTFNWLFSDGATAVTQFPVHQFPAAYSGVWAFVSATDATGCTSYFSFLPTPVPPSNNCSASFSDFANYQFGNQGEIFFFDQSAGQGNGAPVSYQWDFNDGNFSSLQNPSHVFSTSGVYYVCLTVSFANGCSSSFCNSVFVDLSWWTSPPPFPANCTASFQATGGVTGLLNLLNLSQGSNLLYNWTLSNGFVSNLQNPFIIIGAPGAYELCLQIVDTLLACTDTYCDSFYVDTLGNIFRSSFSENASIRVLSPPQPNSLLGENSLAGKTRITISPNPGSGFLSLGNAMQQNMIIEIQDLSGKLIRLLELKAGERQIDVRELPAGMYLFRLLWGEELEVCKQIIND